MPVMKSNSMMFFAVGGVGEFQAEDCGIVFGLLKTVAAFL